jgi:ribosome maturation factor RimP
MGAPRPFFLRRNDLSNVYDKEKSLYREVAPRVERSVPGVEVLAVELSGPERFTVFIDHPQGVDHALCERVTDVLRDYLDRFSIDVSSPGTDRPLREPRHFERVVGRKVALRTADEIAGRTRFRGEVVATDARGLKVATGADEPVDIPYETIVRGNLIGERK